ncbi:MAG: cytochrome c biogenesis protein CcdA [Clostridiaceae bacterium]|nr:cytochrome c biogenesis protein CcdA [Clostridiaceae bacterium]
MQYILTFLEGIITFVSPCLLPMLPMYLSYLAGTDENDKENETIKNAFGFVVGFTIIFVLLGAFAGTIGQFLNQHKTLVNFIAGTVVIVFGLSFLNVIPLPFFKGIKMIPINIGHNFWSAVVFGMSFSVGWTPCVGAFLGSSLMLAAQSGTFIKGVVLLLLYSLGLAIPFIVSAILIDKLKGAFEFLKRNHNAINIISGFFLIIVGILMITGNSITLL